MADWLDDFCPLDTQTTYRVGDMVEAQRTTSLFHRGDRGRIENIQEDGSGRQYPVVKFSDCDPATSVPPSWIRPALPDSVVVHHKEDGGSPHQSKIKAVRRSERSTLNLVPDSVAVHHTVNDLPLPNSVVVHHPLCGEPPHLYDALHELKGRIASLGTDPTAWIDTVTRKGKTYYRVRRYRDKRITSKGIRGEDLKQKMEEIERGKVVEAIAVVMSYLSKLEPF